MHSAYCSDHIAGIFVLIYYNSDMHTDSTI